MGDGGWRQQPTATVDLKAAVDWGGDDDGEEMVGQWGRRRWWTMAVGKAERHRPDDEAIGDWRQRDRG